MTDLLLPAKPSIRRFHGENRLEEDLKNISHRNSQYLYHRCFTEKELIEIVLADIRERLCIEEKSAFALYLDDSIVGLCVCSKLEWDSVYFSMPMARIDYWQAEDVDAGLISELIRKTLNDAVDEYDFRHFSCRISSPSYELFNDMTSLGFRLADVQNVYVAREKGRKHSRGIRSIYNARPYESSDKNALLGLFSKTHFDTRYTRDKNIPFEKSKAMYGEWAHKIMSLSEDQREIYVTDRQDLVAAAGIGRYLDFSRLGINKKIMTDGLFASSKELSGAYVGITSAVVGAGWAQGALLAELKVSMNNRAANRVLQSLGYENVMQSYALHKSLLR